MRELRSIDLKNRSEEEIDNVNQRISKLGVDLNHAKEFSNKQIADRYVITENIKTGVDLNHAKEISQNISKLGVDLNHAKEISNKQIADR